LTSFNVRCTSKYLLNKTTDDDDARSRSLKRANHRRSSFQTAASEIRNRFFRHDTKSASLMERQSRAVLGDITMYARISRRSSREDVWTRQARHEAAYLWSSPEKLRVFRSIRERFNDRRGGDASSSSSSSPSPSLTVSSGSCLEDFRTFSSPASSPAPVEVDPELRAPPHTPESDVYAAGVILSEIASLRSPWDWCHKVGRSRLRHRGRSSAGTMATAAATSSRTMLFGKTTPERLRSRIESAVLGGERPPAPTEAPKGLDRLVRRCCRQDPASRPHARVAVESIRALSVLGDRLSAVLSVRVAASDRTALAPGS